MKLIANLQSDSTLSLVQPNKTAILTPSNKAHNSAKWASKEISETFARANIIFPFESLPTAPILDFEGEEKHAASVLIFQNPLVGGRQRASDREACVSTCWEKGAIDDLHWFALIDASR